MTASPYARRADNRLSDDVCGDRQSALRASQTQNASSVGLSSKMLGNHTDIQFAVNPDFSQVEADVPQVGLNERFALFYPEKRPSLRGWGHWCLGGSIHYVRSFGFYLLWASRLAIVAAAQVSQARSVLMISSLGCALTMSASMTLMQLDLA